MRRRERIATESVEWLSALWQLAEGAGASCANPHLLLLLQLSPGLKAHPAALLVARLRETLGRDLVLKGVVAAVYGQPSENPRERELAAALRALPLELEAILGAGFCAVIHQACTEARERAEGLSDGLDPAAELAEITGELLRLRVVAAPSVFLPLPQAGRHGVMLRRREGSIAHLYFGFPLLQDPERFGINRPWLAGGAWHYAIELYLDRHWPPLAERLLADHALAAAVARALGSEVERRWPGVVREHLNVAFKCLLSRRLGLPDRFHRAFALARGLALFPWFLEWLESAGPAPIAARLAGLPEAFAGERARWEALAPSEAPAFAAINLALVSPGGRRACLVVPDAWPEDAVAAVASGWSLLGLPLLRHGDWVRLGDAGHGRPVIAFGEPGGNPLVEQVLAQRGLSLDALGAGDRAIMALSPLPGCRAAAWCIAVAVTRPESAAAIRAEQALDHTHATVFFHDGVAVGGERAAHI